MTIDFKPDGTATCLHTDEIPLQSIGTMTVRRASNVEWDERAQEWFVAKVSESDPYYHKTLFQSPSRAECLQYERDHWEQLV